MRQRGGDQCRLARHRRAGRGAGLVGGGHFCGIRLVSGCCLGHIGQGFGFASRLRQCLGLGRQSRGPRQGGAGVFVSARREVVRCHRSGGYGVSRRLPRPVEKGCSRFAQGIVSFFREHFKIPFVAFSVSRSATLRHHLTRWLRCVTPTPCPL